MPAKYKAEVSGSSWQQGPTCEFATMKEARQWAEEFGTTADSCTITDAKGRTVAEHRRDTSGDGTRWFRAKPAMTAPAVTFRRTRHRAYRGHGMPMIPCHYAIHYDGRILGEIWPNTIGWSASINYDDSIVLLDRDKVRDLKHAVTQHIERHYSKPLT